MHGIAGDTRTLERTSWMLVEVAVGSTMALGPHEQTRELMPSLVISVSELTSAEDPLFYCIWLEILRHMSER